MNEISHQFAHLINTMLENYDKWEVHSFRIDDLHHLCYGNVKIANWADATYLITWSDCSRCDSAHVNCREMEVLTTDAYEALEFASANGGGR